MASLVSKGEALAAITAEQAAWDALLAEVGEDRMLEPGPVANWTFKDLVAHLVGWDTKSLARLEAIAHGQPRPAPPWPADLDEERDVEAINAWFRAQSQDRLLGAVLQDSREAYARLAAIVELLPEETLNVVGRFPRAEETSLGQALVDGSFFSHFHEEHEPAIRAWLATRGPRDAGDPSSQIAL